MSAATCVRLGLDDPAVALSPTMAEAMATCRPVPQTCDHRPTLALVRRQRAYALLGPRDLRLGRLDEGLAFLARRGLPVFMRIGGGSLVILDEDCLSFALAWPCRSPAHAGAAARLLSEPAVAALAALGLPVRMGRALGSYCEGPSDLVVERDGRKVAGMATALRGGWALVSGMLLVRQDPAYATGLVSGFEAAAGGGRRYAATAVTSIEWALGRAVPVAEVEHALLHALSRWAGAAGRELEVVAPGSAERAQARLLFDRRRVAPGQAAGMARA